MLGHIAIAAMGGCYATQDASGWTDGTYFPTEKVTLVGNIAKRHTLNIGEATYASWFTSTRWWERAQVDKHDGSGYPSLLSMIANVNYRNYGCSVALHNSHLLVYNHNDIEYFSNQAHSEFVTKKDRDSDTIIVETYSQYLEKRLSSSISLNTVAVTFASGPVSASFETQFWGDLLSNDAHHVHWRRLPMSSVERAGIALFDVDGKELIEY